MKKMICVLLTLLIAASCLTITVNADVISDKIDSAVLEWIANADDDGMVVEIRHHNPDYPTDGVSEQEAVQNDLKAQHALFKQIEAISYFEIGTFSVGKMNIGLPYEAIEKVAALDNVDYITLPEEGCYVPAEQKLSEATKQKMSDLCGDEDVDLVIWLAYNTQVYIGIDKENCKTHEEIDAYQAMLIKKSKAYTAKKNEEYIRRITAAVEVEDIKGMKLFPIIFVHTTIDKIMSIAALPEVWTIDISAENEPLDPPIDEPIDAQHSLSEKFEKWMYDTKWAVKGNDDDPIHYGERLEYRDYAELYTCDSWTLIHADFEGLAEPWEFIGSFVLGDRVISWREPGVADNGYYVYNAYEDAFYPIEQVNPDDYDGILNVLKELRIGRPVGDADGDNDLTIMDATAIQRDVADLEKLPEQDVYSEKVATGSWHNVAYADADRDGEVGIMDATRIQRTVADLEELTE